MEQTLLLFAGIIVAYLIGLFSAGKQKRTEAQVIDLNAKIKEKQDADAKAQATADQAVKEYQDALKSYDPNFHNDDGDGKPSA
jgi:hypothetical protein